MVDILDRRGGRRVLQVRNPWSKGGIPHTAFSLGGLHDAISDTPTDLHDDPSKGTFWIDYTTLTRLFKTLYLNWNPRLFTHVKRKHFQFTPTGSDFDVGVNGQYTLTVNGTAETWILLERHYLGKSEGWEGYIGLAVFPGNERIYSYSRPLFRVPSPALWTLDMTFLLTCRRNTWMGIIRYSNFRISKRIPHTQSSSSPMTRILHPRNPNDSSLLQCTRHSHSHFPIPSMHSHMKSE